MYFGTSSFLFLCVCGVILNMKSDTPAMQIVFSLFGSFSQLFAEYPHNGCKKDGDTHTHTHTHTHTTLFSSFYKYSSNGCKPVSNHLPPETNFSFLAR